MTKNSWVCILVAKFCINYTCFKFLDDKYRKKGPQLYSFFSSGLLSQATAFNYCCPSGTDTVTEIFNVFSATGDAFGLQLIL